MDENQKEWMQLPLLPMRGINVFPGMTLTFDVERSGSTTALLEANRGAHIVFLVCQRDLSVDLPQEADLFSVGVVCRVRQQLRQQHGAVRVMVEGLYRAELQSADMDAKGYSGLVRELPDRAERCSHQRLEALMRSCLEHFSEYLHLDDNLPGEQLLNVLSNPDLSFVGYYIAQHVRLNYEDKQSILEECVLSRRLMLINRLLANEIEVMSIEQELNAATAEQMNRNNREYYLREELKLIQAELGEDTDDDDDYRARLDALPVSEEIHKKLLKELSHLKKQPFGSSEAAVIRSYLDTVLEFPWGKKSQETVDIEKARRVLDDDHFGLEKVKERILEYLSVKQLSSDIKGGLICLVGPPGTGKTSIALSIARATNRKCVRLSLGGVHDEADIRGHRRTYIGSMPGRIVSGIIQAGTCNPLLILDEIDKLGSDYRGDPSAALLEALDPEQNSSFRDHFLEVPIDLSEVFFITTANTTDTIPRALLDRMELIELSSYTDEEKLQIAKRHLLPKQRKKHGLKATQLKLGDDAIRAVIRSYTRESGVRTLERELAALCRKAAGQIVGEGKKSVTVRPEGLERLLGPAKFKSDEFRLRDEVGLVRGLAWTSVGGEVLDVEVAVLPGSGKLELTGNLGDVMKESARAAISYIRSRAELLGIDPEFYKNKDIHIHFPEGAVPKDGPSAGITVTIAVISALTGTPVRHEVAMTGEITLRGRVLPIGGLREKTMAAFRAGETTVIIPRENESDLADIDPTVRAALHFVPVSHADEALDVALLRDAARPYFPEYHPSVASAIEGAALVQ